MAFSPEQNGFVSFTSFAFAEDSVSSFQQEIVYAKQKHDDIVSKVNEPSLIVEDKKDDRLEKEAGGLLNELTAKGYSTSSPVKESSSSKSTNSQTSLSNGTQWAWASKLKSILIHDKPVKEIKLEPMKMSSRKSSPENAAEDKGWFLRKFNYKEKKPTDGELLFKVAVSDNKISLKEAVEIAEANSIAIKAYQQKVEAAKAKLVEAKRALYPTVQAVVTADGGLASQVSTEDPHGRFYEGKSQKINVSQPVFYGGELQLTVKQAEANVKSVELELKKLKSELVYQVKSAYFGAVKAQYNLQYQVDLYNEVSVIHEQIMKGYKEKVVPEIDYLNAESEFQQIYFQVEGARNDLASAALVLLQTLGLPPDRNCPLDLHLNFVKVNPEMDEMIELALQNNPDVQIKEYALQSAKYGLQVYQAKKYPRIDLRGSYGYLGENFRDTLSFQNGNNDVDTEKEWFVGFQGSMPLGPNSVEYSQIKHKYGPTVIALHGSEDFEHKVTFNLFDKLGDITDEKSARAALLQAQSDLEKSKNDVTVKIRDDFYNLQKSLIQIDSSAAKLRYQEKQNNILKYTVAIQEAQIRDLIEGLIEITQDRYSFIQAISDYHIAVASLNQSIGDPDYFDAEPQ